MKVYFGLDLGSKTCGVAISTSGVIASGLTTIRFNDEDYQECLTKLLPLIKEHGVTTVILGYPKHMNNDVGIRGMISKQFLTMLEENSKVEVILWDERLSTSLALKALATNNKKKTKQKELKDQMAAQLILQNYLDYKGR